MTVSNIFYFPYGDEYISSSRSLCVGRNIKKDVNQREKRTGEGWLLVKILDKKEVPFWNVELSILR